jgi:hypothetical protein
VASIYVAPVEAGAEHQPIEAVVLHLARPDARQRRVEDVAQAAELDLASSGEQHAEIMDPHGALGLPWLHHVRRLADHLEAHMLEHG